ncbi:3'(2'),5'-bisphosphate nucleotidase CysQ [Ciceribacter azotifigens]|uniref:3'(2'),5'-bisphosphate nucleotidase CysQ n=1 Tax=Ciceribacter azotifigens TaxID=2069303 RepID=UPI003A88EFEE
MTAAIISDWQADLDLIAAAAREAGAVAFTFFGQSPQVWWKNEGRSPVSVADHAANECLEERLRTARPSYGWLSEETDDDLDRLKSDTLFVVDPIDGTRAFIANKPTWCVSVAVVHRGKPVAGVLVAPAFGEEYSAVDGGPALKNGQPIAVAAFNPAKKLRVATPLDIVDTFDAPLKGRIDRIEHVPSLAYRIAMVAEGRIDATFVKPNSHDWDIAAADLILQRAGGRLADLDGNALVYNRPEVTHGILCAAVEGELPGLLERLAAFPRG